jgi:hypothetical protein
MSPTGTIMDPLQPRFLAPPFEKAAVVDAMRVGVVRESRERARSLPCFRT